MRSARRFAPEIGRTRRSRFPRPASVLFVLAGLVCGCVTPGGTENGGDARPGRLALTGPDLPAGGLQTALAQFQELLSRVATLPVQRVATTAEAAAVPGTLLFAVGPCEPSEALIPAAERQTLKAGGYILRRGTVQGVPVLAAAGADDLGDQYAAYALLERLGFGFFHPEETFLPAPLTVPAVLDETWEPSYAWRGMHLHTMHPIELMDSVLVPGEEHLREARRYVDWLVANRQNYFQWVLQDTIDIEAWVPHAAAIIDYAHRRGLRVGIDTPFEFIQQNAFVLAPDPNLPYEPQIRENLARVLRAPWDVINAELGAAEWIPADDVRTLGMLDFTAAHLDAEYGVELVVKVHCTSGQTAPNFGGINFNFLPGIADPRVGVMPHTVQFYDLFRKAPTYGQDDFSGIRGFLLGEIGERKVLYYPETAYWVSFDVDIPIFLPHYVFSRWNDLHRLADSGLDGQINFSSGFEWGYWLNDWAAAGFSYEAATPWADYLARFTRIFGAAADGMRELLEDLIEEQGRDLLEADLIGYLIGWDSADDFGHTLADTHFQPRRVLFHELRNMEAAELEDFERTVLAALITLERTYGQFTARVATLEPGVPANARKWYREILHAVEVTSLRARHVRCLYQGTVLKTKQRLGLDPRGKEQAEAVFAEALETRKAAEACVALQEQDYRFPAERIARHRENPTSYEFGYLYTTSDCYYWRREEFQALNNNTCLCLGNITNLLANLFGEGHPVDLLARSFPRVLGNCLDGCLHPSDRIREIGDPL